MTEADECQCIYCRMRDRDVADRLRLAIADEAKRLAPQSSTLIEVAREALRYIEAFEKPTPGSDAAIRQGCTCPVMDNQSPAKKGHRTSGLHKGAPSTRRNRRAWNERRSTKPIAPVSSRL